MPDRPVPRPSSRKRSSHPATSIVTNAATADEITAAGYRVDDTPIHDVNTHLEHTRAQLGNRGENMALIARSLATIADELATRTTTVTGQVTTLDSELASVRTALDQVVQDAFRYPLAINRDYNQEAEDLKAVAVDLVRTTGGTVHELVNGYEEILTNRLKTLADMGYEPPAELDVGNLAGHGADSLPIPGPPPNPATDPGAGEHGSDPWYSRGDDLFMKALAGDATTFAEGIGWTHAAGHLRHYLDNSGTDRTVSPMR